MIVRFKNNIDAGNSVYIIVFLISFFVYVAVQMSGNEYVVLYTDLELEDARQIVDKLESSGVDYQLEKNGTEILVPESDVNRLRIETVDFAPNYDDRLEEPLVLIKDMDSSMKECLLYLPLQSVVSELQIVTDEDSRVLPIDNPFKGRIAVFGSSYTHGSHAERPALTYSAQLSRMTGYQFINMGFCGNSKLQPYFADALLDAENVDAYVFDAFSNPTPEQMEERLFPFIEKFQAAKPGIPLIFIKTLYREKRNFNPEYEAREQAKMDMADSLMTIAVQKYPNVYWIETTNTLDGTHEWTADGSHPSGYGYHLMAKSLREPLETILATCHPERNEVKSKDLYQ